MKKFSLVTAMVVLVLVMAGGAWAAGSTTSTVGASATIVTKCVAGGSPAVTFGSLDASTTGPYAGVVTDPTLWCTASDSIAITDNGGQNFSAGSFRLKSGSNYIDYTLTYTSPLTGQGKATDIGGQGAGKLGLVATIPAGNIDNAPAGAYSDSVILTFTY